jgi:hypothetical protein
LIIFKISVSSFQADPERLARIRDAFKLIMKINSNDFVLEQQEEKDFGIKHIVPQHRQVVCLIEDLKNVS